MLDKDIIKMSNTKFDFLNALRAIYLKRLSIRELFFRDSKA